MSKRLIALFALVIMLSGLISSPARANVLTDGTYDCATGSITNTEPTFSIVADTIVSASACVGTITIPSGVKSIGGYSFQATTLSSIAIPATVTTIDDVAFNSSPSLTSVTFESSSQLTSIGEFAFSDTGISGITLPLGLTSIGGGAFARSALTSITIPAGVEALNYDTFADAASLTSVTFEPDSKLTSIENNVFRNTALTSIALPPSITSIAVNAFEGALELTSINVDGSSNNFKAINGVLFNGNATALVLYPAGKTGSYIVPAGVTSVSEFAFHRSLVTSISIPASVRSLGYNSFGYTSLLKSVAFATNSQLESMDDSVFTYSGITRITIPKNVQSIGNYAFEDSSISSITFAVGSRLSSLGKDAFRNSSLKSINIPALVTEIKGDTFDGASSLTSVTFAPGSKLTRIGKWAFQETALKTFIIPEGVTSIGYKAFSDTSLETIRIPAALIEIEEGSFSSVQTLRAITVDSKNKVYSAKDGVLFNKNYTTLFTYPASKLGSTYSIPSTVNRIAGAAFYGASRTNTVFIPESVTTIGDGAFGGMQALKTMFIPRSVTEIGNYVFAGTSSLDSVTFDPSIQLSFLPQGMFNGSAIKAIVLPATVTEIGNYAFARTSALTSVFIPEGVTRISSRAFYNSLITSLTLPASIDTLVEDAFSFMPSLTNLSFLGNAPSVTDEFGSFGFENPNYLFEQLAPSISACVRNGSADTFSNNPWHGIPVVVCDDTVTFETNGGFRMANAMHDGVSIRGAAVPFRTGYTFTGWAFVDGGKAISFPHQLGESGDVSLFANWIPSTHTVTYVSNGGSAVTSGSFVTEGQVIATPKPPTRKGYKFEGWSASDGGAAVTFPYRPNATSSISLYAKWTAVLPKVTPTKLGSAKSNTLPKFLAGSSSLSKASKTVIQKIVKEATSAATFTVSGAASKSFGVPSRFLEALALARAEKVKAYLRELGVKKSKIKIVIQINESRVAPNTTIKIG